MKIFLFLSLCLVIRAFSQSASLDGSNNWNTGYRLEVTVNNSTTQQTDGWLVVLNLGAGQSPANDVANANLYQPLTDAASGVFAFVNKGYNAVLGVGASTSFGFNVDPDNGSDPPVSAEQVVLNFDPAAQPSFSISDVSILEGDTETKQVTLTVSLNPSSNAAASVDFATVDNSASVAEDYTAVSGTLDFAAGETEKNIVVPILGDLIDEGDESFIVRLSNSVGALLSKSDGIVTIEENDIVADLTISNSSIFENGSGQLLFTVSLTPSAQEVVTVDYTTGGGNATAGSDYIATSGNLTFAPGEQLKTIAVTVLDDLVEEFSESFNVTLSNAVNADLARAVAVGSILDDEQTGIGKPETGMFNYAEVLQKSMYFYEAQRSGDLPETNRVSWRADSALNDGSDIGRDLTGGWYDAGDHVKFGFPMANSASILAWGGIEFLDAYVETGQYTYLLENLRWVCDYFLKCHERDASGATTQFWGQVAAGGLDHAYWGSAELNPQLRKSFKIDRLNPGTDLACETAAALAACSMIFRSVDSIYADTLLEHARALYTFGDTYRGVYSESISDAAAFYRSFSGYSDELLWGALWLYRATGESSYLDRAYTAYTEQFFTGGEGAKLDFGPSWDDKRYGSLVLMAQLLKDDPTNDSDSDPNNDDDDINGLVQTWLNKWVDGDLSPSFTITPGGLRWLLQWGCLRYTANTSMLAFIYAKNVQDPGGAYQALGESQLNYILGNNPQNVSYVIGFGSDYPTHPHHRGAHGGWRNSGPEEDADGNQFPSRNILYGGLVGGPITPEDGGWIPWRYKRDGSAEAFQANEVATDYNAGFTACVARMYELYGGSPLQNFPPETIIPEGTEMFVSAAVTSNENRFTQLRFFANNRSYAPARVGAGLSFRYYLDLSELYANGLTKNDVEISFNPILGSGSSGAAPSISSLISHDEENYIYYVEIDLGGQMPLPIGESPSRVEIQIRFGLPASAPSNIWDPSNDFSYTNTSIGSTNLSYSGFIPMYQNGELIDGMVPNGGGVVTPSAFDIWQTGQFTSVELTDLEISGPLADPDGDGHLNIIEYAFGLNPKQKDRSELFTMGLNLARSKVTFQYSVNPNAQDATIHIQGSSSLDSNSWGDLSLTELPESAGQMKAMEANLPTNAKKYFFRTRVELQGQ